MKLAILSDQHGSLPEIPECDVMILAGDLTGGNPTGVRDEEDERWWKWLHTTFAEWVRPVSKVFAVAGNHDTCIETMGIPSVESVTFLHDRGSEYMGITFYGSPWVRRWDSLAFGLPEDALWEKLSMVPSGTDILISHMPPLGIRDNGLGSTSVLRVMEQVRPIILACGHIHEAPGLENYYTDGRCTAVVNGSGGFVTIEITGR